MTVELLAGMLLPGTLLLLPCNDEQVGIALLLCYKMAVCSVLSVSWRHRNIHDAIAEGTGSTTPYDDQRSYVGSPA